MSDCDSEFLAYTPTEGRNKVRVRMHRICFVAARLKYLWYAFALAPCIYGTPKLCRNGGAEWAKKRGEISF